MIKSAKPEESTEADLKTIILHQIVSHSETVKRLEQASIEDIKAASIAIASTLKYGGTVYWCGNGGSASDSQHMSAELIGRFKKDRKPLRSIALAADMTAITCIANDFGYDKIFSRQLEALGEKGDTLVAISTSGNSQNIINVLETANAKGIKTISLLGKGGGIAKEIAKISIMVDSEDTARIQECHELIGHTICSAIENILGVD